MVPSNICERKINTSAWMGKAVSLTMCRLTRTKSISFTMRSFTALESPNKVLEAHGKVAKARDLMIECLQTLVIFSKFCPNSFSFAAFCPNNFRSRSEGVVERFWTGYGEATERGSRSRRGSRTRFRRVCKGRFKRFRRFQGKFLERTSNTLRDSAGFRRILRNHVSIPRNMRFASEIRGKNAFWTFISRKRCAKRVTPQNERTIP